MHGPIVHVCTGNVIRESRASTIFDYRRVLDSDVLSFQDSDGSYLDHTYRLAILFLLYLYFCALGLVVSIIVA